MDLYISKVEKTMEYRKINSKYIDDILKLDSRFGSPWSRGLYLDRLSMFPDLSYGVFKNGKLIGFILGKKEPIGNIKISRLVVDEKYEGRGIGGHLVDVLTKKADEKTKKMRSIIRESNKRSIKLHKHRGFEIYDYHTYKDGEKGIKFLKRL